jgi:hypothetical protein
MGLFDMDSNELARAIGQALIYLIASGTLIEISPIKFNPITMVLKWMGDKMNSGIKAELDALKKAQEEQRKDFRDYKVAQYRYEIFQFENEIRDNNDHHTEEQYNHILEQCKSYEDYCKEYNIPNGKAEMAIKHIRDVCYDHLRDDSFQK